MSNDTQDLFDFGSFRLEASERRLSRDGQPVPLTGKAFDVLHLLVRRAGRTVTKEEFMSVVWAGTTVEEANLADNISTLRQALNDDARDPRYIETVPKRGYRFVAEVLPAAPTASVAPSPRRWLPAIAVAAVLVIAAVTILRLLPRSAGSAHTLAVLPFKPLVRADRDPALEMGMTDALIARLSRIRSLRVRPTAAIMPYAETATDFREIAAKLDVDSVLDGKLQKSGDRVRVSVQLVRAADGSILWAGRFDEPFTDIFSLQDAISERVATALQIRLTSTDRQALRKRYTDNVEAYQLYLNGIEQWRTFTPDGLMASVNYQNAALKLDPDYALAWAGLAKAYNVLGIWGSVPAREAFPRSQAAAKKGLALDPNIAETHIPVAAGKLFYERDWSGAQRELDAAEELDPSHGDLHTLRGYYLQAMGRPDQALVELQRARDAAPDWEIAKYDLLHAYVIARRFDDALREARKMIALDPGPRDPQWVMGDALAAKGQYGAAIQSLEQAVKPPGAARVRIMGTLAWTYAKAGRPDRALELIEQIRRNDTPWMPMSMAEAYAGLGDHDAVFIWLNRACDDLFPFVWDVRNRHEYDGIRGDARYVQLLARMNLRP